MRYGRYGTSYLFLRLGLGLTFMWIGIDIFRHPDIWVGYLPTTIPFGLSRDLALQIAGGVDVLIGALFLTDSFARTTALLSSIHMAAILVMLGLNAVLVRDVGLLGASLALLFWPHHRRRRRWWQKIFRGSSGSSSSDT